MANFQAKTEHFGDGSSNSDDLNPVAHGGRDARDSADVPLVVPDHDDSDGLETGAPRSRESEALLVLPSGPSLRAALAPSSVLWNFEDDRALYVFFKDGPQTLQEKVLGHFKTWTDEIDVAIVAVDDVRKANIRVSFNTHDPEGSWAKLGTHALRVPLQLPTMNLSIDENTPDLRVQELALHEFGHVLGFYHEQSSPGSTIKWDEPKVIEFYKKNYGWSAKDVRMNVLAKCGVEQCSMFSAFDKESIMLYSVDGWMTSDGFSSETNVCLSAMDKEWVAKAYPKPKTELCPHQAGQFALHAGVPARIKRVHFAVTANTTSSPRIIRSSSLPIRFP